MAATGQATIGVPGEQRGGPPGTGRRPLPPRVRVAVIGAGFGGVAMAIGLLQAGIRDIVVLERADGIGGTWRDNTYPGCACDVPSALYSYSFAPDPGWSHRFAGQAEIQDYLRRTATRFGVDPLLRLGAGVTSARWDPSGRCWHVGTARGPLVADVVVSACGPLSAPHVPTLAGLESFEGTTFHSAAWDHGHDLRGRRVAVVGAGASAIQLVPQVQRLAERVVVLQRTPPWVLPRRDRLVTTIERAAFRRLPATQALVRAGTYWSREVTVLGFSGRTRLLEVAQRQAGRFLERSVPDPELRAKLTPTYAFGCKRVLLSDDYYPALNQPNVDVVVDPVERVGPQGPVTVGAGGRRTEHRVDTIVFGTGFTVTDPPISHRVVGTDGRTLAEHWAGTGMQAHLGVAVAGFPNFFHLMGPNTGQGHTSALVMIEAQVGYVVDLLARMDAAGNRHGRAAWAGAARVERPGAPRSRRGRSGTPVAAPAGTWTPTAATPRCGRPSPPPTGGGWPAHGWRTTP